MFSLHLMGHAHKIENKNRQDISSAYRTKKDKRFVGIICDGCSSLPYPEVGATLFCRLFRNKFEDTSMDVENVIRETLKTILDIMSNNSQEKNDDTIYAFLGFTILIVVEYENEFKVYSAGDGTIVTVDVNDIVQYNFLEDGVHNVPRYLAYDYLIDKSSLEHYKDGVQITVNTFNKFKYRKVGVASDGLHYMLTSNKTNIRIAFEKELLSNSNSDKEKKNRLEELFISNHQIFEDDLSLAIN